MCVFCSHLLWTSSSLDIPAAGVTQEEGHTGFLIHLPSAMHAFIFLARRIQPFLSLVDREVEFLCVCVCFLPIHSGHQVRWTYQPGSHRRRSHMISHPPSFCGACLNFSREKDSAIPFPRRL